MIPLSSPATSRERTNLLINARAAAAAKSDATQQLLRNTYQIHCSQSVKTNRLVLGHVDIGRSSGDDLGPISTAFVRSPHTFM